MGQVEDSVSGTQVRVGFTASLEAVLASSVKDFNTCHSFQQEKFLHLISFFVS